MRIQRPDMDLVAELSSLDEYNSLPGLLAPLPGDPETPGYIVDRTTKIQAGPAVEAGYITWIEKTEFDEAYGVTTP